MNPLLDRYLNRTRLQLGVSMNGLNCSKAKGQEAIVNISLGVAKGIDGSAMSVLGV